MADMDLEDFRALTKEHSIHTVEIVHPDNYGHLRGKRMPVDRFFGAGQKGIGIADAVFIFDPLCDLVDNPWISMESGFLDTILIPDVSTARLLSHRPGYAMVFAKSLNEEGETHEMSPRNLLAAQVERCRAAGVDPYVATEIEFYLFTPEWQPIQNYIQYSSMTDSFEVDDILLDMRNALADAGMEVETANAEYGPGQFEINVGPGDAMTTADNTVLLKTIIKQVARQHGVRASFMPKPAEPDSGSGLHIHTSLLAEDGSNAFADSDGKPNELMAHWIAGILDHAPAMSLVNSLTPNGYKRVRPYTFAPTHIHWGLDNRTVMARCMAEKGSAGNRVEYRCAGADTNPYVALAAVLASGIDGLERKLELPEMATGDMYAEPRDCVALPTTLGEAIKLFEGSMLAELFGEKFSTTWLELAKWEQRLFAEAGCEEDDEVTDWERERYIEHT